MSYRFVGSFREGPGWNWIYQFHPGPSRKLSTNLYDIYYCWVYSKSTPDDGQTNCPKHVEFHATICEIGASSWFYYKEIYYDARSHERKIQWRVRACLSVRPSSSSLISEKTNRVILKFSKFGVLTAMFLKLRLFWRTLSCAAERYLRRQRHNIKSHNTWIHITNFGTG